MKHNSTKKGITCKILKKQFFYQIKMPQVNRSKESAKNVSILFEWALKAEKQLVSIVKLFYIFGTKNEQTEKFYDLQ